jgi:LuxR family transcriptional regulator, maltose regulon positive regulatory protein
LRGELVLHPGPHRLADIASEEDACLTTAETEAVMRIRHSSHQGYVVLTLAGRLDPAGADQVREAVLKQVAEDPPAIICDLGQVEAVDPACAGVFTSIRHPALGWPGTALVLCRTPPAVADVLVRQGVTHLLAMYPTIDQALAGVCDRPEWLCERLALGPVPTAARASRAFVAELCGRWGLQELAGSAALLASELVTNAVVHAGTALELRVEVHGARLYLAVGDQDPDVARLLAAGDGPERGVGLRIVDRVATSWGARQDAVGKTVWCTMDPPQRHADRGPPDATGPPGPDLMLAKLRPPAPRAGLIPRAGLQSRLQAGLEGKLCLLDAPAGSGKTTLLTQWCATAGAGRVAWVSLEESDSDPIRFWTYVVEALQAVEAGVGAGALAALGRPGADLHRAVLPPLLNELGAVGSELVLVLDDYHLITDPSCHQTLGFFLDHLPAQVHLVLSTRVDPPLPLARMRARGELAELRVAELEFSDQEAFALLNGSMGLRLAPEDVELLAERTEGWAAGLYLAGLSLRGRADPADFIGAFAGDNRHVVDYLGAEVLARQPERIRAFLLRTSVLERLSGPLCDAVLEAEGSAEVLGELERSNLFLVPLDDRREWYRYHHLFAQLLGLELAGREPGLLPVLHRRAAAWHRRAGNLDEAIHHASAAGDFTEAAALIAGHWLGCWRRGGQATVARWLDELPEAAVTADPPVAYVAAWVGGFSGASKQETERLLAATEDDTWDGVLPDGISSLAFGAALTRAALVFDDVGRSAGAARRALELAGPEPSPFWWMAQAALGHALYLSARPAEARPGLEEVARVVSPATQPYALLTALAVLSLITGDDGDEHAAATLARRAAAVAEAQGLSTEPLSGIAYIALGRALARQGELTQAEAQLGRALELVGIDSMVVQRAFALLLLASVRRGCGDLPGGRALVERARELIGPLTDPGMLPALLEQAEQASGPAPRRQGEPAEPLTERELAVLRLLPARLSNREIGRQLYVSVNTVRSHIQAVYRKLGVGARAEAVARARELGLLQPSTSPERSRHLIRDDLPDR